MIDYSRKNEFRSCTEHEQVHVNESCTSKNRNPKKNTREKTHSRSATPSGHDRIARQRGLHSLRVAQMPRPIGQLTQSLRFALALVHNDLLHQIVAGLAVEQRLVLDDVMFAIELADVENPAPR